jgi:hypothetical protein
VSEQRPHTAARERCTRRLRPRDERFGSAASLARRRIGTVLLRKIHFCTSDRCPPRIDGVGRRRRRASCSTMRPMRSHLRTRHIRNGSRNPNAGTGLRKVSDRQPSECSVRRHWRTRVKACRVQSFSQFLSCESHRDSAAQTVIRREFKREGPHIGGPFPAGSQSLR